MIVELNSYISHDHVGNKAKSLVELNRYGYKVPKAIALDTTTFFQATKSIHDKINVLLEKLSLDNIDMIERQIDILFEEVSIDDNTIYELKKFIGRSDKYIIRCSIDGVDKRYTFAGLYEPIMVDDVEQSIIDAYKKLYSYNSLYYILKNKIDYKNIGLCLVFQKYIDNVKLCFVSTANAVTLATNELMIDIIDHNNKEKWIDL